MKLIKMNTKGYTAALKRYIGYVEALPILPPKNGSSYSQMRQRFITGENTSVLLTEKQSNLAKTLADNPDMKVEDAFIISGYAYALYFNEAGTVTRTKAHLVSNFNRRFNKDVMALSNYLKYGSAEELKIDATWLLNEQVGLYEEVRREKQYTQAIRLLDSISLHVDVDARVSNKVIVEGSVDYAALLSQASDRLTLDDPNVIEGELIESIELIESTESTEEQSLGVSEETVETSSTHSASRQAETKDLPLSR